MSRSLAQVLTLVALVVAATAASAAPGAAEALRNPSVDSFPTPMVAPLTKIGFALAAISALSAGLALWSRRRRKALGGTNANIRILANRSLSNRHQVVLLDVGGHRLLVGTGGDAVTILADLTETELFSDKLDRHLPRAESRPEPDFLEKIGKFEGLDA